MGCTLTWVSMLQSKIPISTMEAEYIALSNSMGELIGIIEVIKEIQFFSISVTNQNPKCRTHSKTFFLDDISPSKFHEDNVLIELQIFLHILIKFPYHITSFGPSLNHSKLRFSQSIPMISYRKNSPKVSSKGSFNSHVRL